MPNSKKKSPGKRLSKVILPRNCNRGINYNEAISPSPTSPEPQPECQSLPSQTDLTATSNGQPDSLDKLAACYNSLLKNYTDLSTRMDTQMAVIESRFNSLEDQLKSDLNELRGQIGQVREKQVETNTDFDNRLGVLEFNIGEQKSAIKNMKDTIDRLSEENEHNKRTSESYYKELVHLKKRDSDNLSTTLIFSGTAIPSLPNDSELVTFTTGLFARLTNHKIDASEILVAERFGKPSVSNSQERHSIKVKLRSREMRSNIISTVLRVKPAGFYVNELLSSDVYRMFRSLQKYRKDNRSSFKALFTRNGIIRVQVASDDKKYDIYTNDDLRYFTSLYRIPLS